MTTKTRAKPKPPTVNEAKERADGARSLYLDLRNRLRDGDTSVTRDALEKARADADYLDDLLEGARAIQRRAQQEAFAEWARDFADRLRGEVDAGNAEVAEKADALRDAVREFAEAVHEVNGARRALSVEWEDHRPEDVPLGPDFARDLPEEYLAVKPIRLHSYSGTFDPLRLTLGLSIEALEQVRKPTTSEQQEMHRQLTRLAAAPLTYLRNAIDHQKDD